MMSERGAKLIKLPDPFRPNVGGVVGGVGVGLVVRTEVEGETVVDEAEMEGEISVKVAVVTIGVSNDLVMEISLIVSVV